MSLSLGTHRSGPAAQLRLRSDAAAVFTSFVEANAEVLDGDLVLIMDAQWFDFYEKVPLSEEDMEDVARNTYELAMSRDDVVAIIGYTWPGGLDVPEQLGARSLPEAVQSAYREIGLAIVD